MSGIGINQVSGVAIKTTLPHRAAKRAKEIVRKTIEDGNIAQIDVLSDRMSKRAYVLVESDIDHIEAELTFEEEYTQKTNKSFAPASEVLSL